MSVFFGTMLCKRHSSGLGTTLARTRSAINRSSSLSSASQSGDCIGAFTNRKTLRFLPTYDSRTQTSSL